MDLAQIDLSEYKGKKVTLVRKLDKPNAEGHQAEEIEGTVLSGNNEVGIFIKAKGRTMGELVKVDQIEDVRVLPTTIKALKAKAIKMPTLDNVRQHLLDKHGFSISFVNTADEERAAKLHAAIDHSDLGHNHDEKADA